MIITSQLRFAPRHRSARQDAVFHSSLYWCVANGSAQQSDGMGCSPSNKYCEGIARESYRLCTGLAVESRYIWEYSMLVMNMLWVLGDCCREYRFVSQ